MAGRKKSSINGLIGRKKLEETRRLVRDLFINGFRNRNGINRLLGDEGRAADSTRQIVAIMLNGYYKFEKKEGGRYSVSIDTRQIRHNPFHNIWKLRTFSDTDIVLYFLILDSILYYKEMGLSATQDIIYEHVVSIAEPDEDEESIPGNISEESLQNTEVSISRDKLKSALFTMSKTGLISEKNREYSVNPSFTVDSDMLDFASEIMPLGTIGSYIIDRQGNVDSVFYFKHNTISNALDDEVLYLIFEAMNQHREVVISEYSWKEKKYRVRKVVPLLIVRNVQTCRQYLACRDDFKNRFRTIRLDYIKIVLSSENKGVYMGALRDDYDSLKSECRNLYNNVWGVTLFNTQNRPMYISFTIQVDKETEYIKNRLYREKRGGKVESLGDNKYKFSMYLYDTREILPWITTFYGRIVDIEIEDSNARKQLKKNFELMVDKHL